MAAHALPRRYAAEKSYRVGQARPDRTSVEDIRFFLGVEIFDLNPVGPAEVRYSVAIRLIPSRTYPRRTARMLASRTA
jgi:hypothetical protein